MADSVADGRTRVWMVPAIANLASPVAATELAAGTALDGLMTPDGLVGFEPDTADVDTSKLNSTFSTTSAGRASFSGTLLRFIKQIGTDVVYNTLVYGYTTFIVIRRDITVSTAWTAGQACEVYPIQCGEIRNLAPVANAVHQYEVMTKITSQPNLRAVVS
jgi:hypothetical protein